MSTSEFGGVVQFPHPGTEHKCAEGWTRWNTNDHRRKFMLNEAIYLDENNAEQQGDVTFWGEWEAPSEQISSWPSGETLPRSLVRPHFPGPLIGTGQNTDPYVFGDSFKYSVCKQFRKPRPGHAGRSTYLARLAVGSLILFGSKLDHEFVLDTAFVVGSSVPYTPATWTKDVAATTSAVYRSVTFAPAHTTFIPEVSDVPLRLYSGATPANTVQGTYSFFPCLPVTDGSYPRFSRPVIRLDNIINPALMMSSRRTELPQDAIVEAWSSIRQQVLDADLLLGVAAAEPSRSHLVTDFRRGLVAPRRC